MSMPKLCKPPVECKKLSFTPSSFDNLKKWSDSLKKDPEKLSILQSASSLNASDFLFKHGSSSKKSTNSEDDQFAKVNFAFETKETDLTKRRNLLSLIASKLDNLKQVFVEIECLEYGVDSKIANDRVNLLVKLLRDIPSFLYEANKFALKKSHSYMYDRLDPMSFLCPYDMDDMYYTYDQLPSFMELFWWVIVSILDDPTSHLFPVVQPVLLPSFLLAEILNECNVKTRVSASYTPYATITADDYTGQNVPMIILSNADFDSALDAAVNAAWFTEGLVPWATTCVLVQESIYSNFISSVKNRLLASAENIAAVLTNLNVETETAENVDSVLSLAKELNLEVFQVSPSVGKRVPATMVIGGFVSTLISLTSRTVNKTLPILFVVPFRTMQEGLSLANGSVDKIAVSVWSESFSACSSAITQLNFGTIWVNSHGSFDSLVPLFSQDTGCEPVRPTGMDFYQWNKSLIHFGSNLTSEDANYSEAAVLKLLSESYAAHSSWVQKNLHEVVKILDDLWKHAAELNFPLSLNLKKQLIDAVCGKVPSGNVYKVKDSLVSLSVEPVGIIIFVIEECLNMKKHHLLKFVLSAIFSKNAVVVSGGKFNISTLQSLFPENVLYLAGKIPLDNLCHIVRRHKLRTNISIWTLNDDETKCFTHWEGDFLKYCKFDNDVDIIPHMVRRKVIWMPHDKM